MHPIRDSAPPERERLAKYCGSLFQRWNKSPQQLQTLSWFSISTLKSKSAKCFKATFGPRSKGTPSHNLSRCLSDELRSTNIQPQTSDIEAALGWEDRRSEVAMKRIAVPQRGIRKGGSNHKIHLKDTSKSLTCCYCWIPLFRSSLGDGE